jgi:hypothetical protein
VTLPANDDFVDVVRCLDDARADFIVVGAYALAANGVVRATADIDIFVRASADNAARVYDALLAFGAPLAAHDVKAEDFTRVGTVYQMGLPPRRIDILTEISGVTYGEAAEDVVEGHLGDRVVRFLGRKALIRNKRAAGRHKDLGDAEALEELGADD